MVQLLELLLQRLRLFPLFRVLGRFLLRFGVLGCAAHVVGAVGDWGRIGCSHGAGSVKVELPLLACSSSMRA